MTFLNSSPLKFAFLNVNQDCWQVPLHTWHLQVEYRYDRYEEGKIVQKQVTGSVGVRRDVGPTFHIPNSLGIWALLSKSKLYSNSAIYPVIIYLTNTANLDVEEKWSLEKQLETKESMRYSWGPWFVMLKTNLKRETRSCGDDWRGLLRMEHFHIFRMNGEGCINM